MKYLMMFCLLTAILFTSCSKKIYRSKAQDAPQIVSVNVPVIDDTRINDTRVDDTSIDDINDFQYPDCTINVYAVTLYAR